MWVFRAQIEQVHGTIRIGTFRRELLMEYLGELSIVNGGQDVTRPSSSIKLSDVSAVTGQQTQPIYTRKIADIFEVVGVISTDNVHVTVIRYSVKNIHINIII